jgi:hypothetical protein
MKNKCVLEVVTDATYLLGHRVRFPHCSGGIVWSGVDGVHWQHHNKSFEFDVVQTGAYFWFSGNSVFPLFYGLFFNAGEVSLTVSRWAPIAPSQPQTLYYTFVPSVTSN